jgi:DNA-binding response OmpR family regulator
MSAATALVLAEPEPDTRGFLTHHLADDGFDVVGAEAGGEALELVERERPEVVVLGSPLPDSSPLELCRRLRTGEPGRTWNRDVPVILLGGEDADALDRVRAFERGCDDYVTRPFVYEELLARIRAVLRRTRRESADRLAAGDIVVDRVARTVTARGQRVDLSGREYELLLALAVEPLRVFSKEELLRDVWGFRAAGRTRTLDSHASRLRRKLAVDGAGPFVTNIWGVGYRLLDS